MPVFETPGSVSLQIKLPSGRVEVTTVDEPRTTVEVVSGRRGSDAVDDVEIRCVERHGGHVVTIERRDQLRWGPIQISWGGDLEVRITCPPGANLEFSSGSADLRVEGDLGSVNARTASGDIKLDDVRDKLQAKTASGDLRVGAAASGGSVNTVSGDLTVERVDETLTARTISGDVRIGALNASLTLGTTSGDVDIRSVSAGKIGVQTVSGDVRIAIARGTLVWIDAVSVSGDLESQIGMADSVPDGEGEESGEVVPLHVKTVSGDVQIVHAAETYSR
jgi:DUF4097 and DUF4098 domain-containing protein YvlB